MAMMQCNACGGVYDNGLPDGVQYFHACPPLSSAEARAAIASGAVVLTKRQADRLAALDRAPADAATGAPSAAAGDAYLADLALPRPSHRDENLDPAKIATARDKRTGNVAADVEPEALMRAVGAGVTALDADADGVA